ncbi:MAG: four helix bundle protein [candidate division Zixibacteria bacterium]|nr:four helix bundle protein [candidate division Zixibacteria bacterium]MCK4428646.1 four helix bundle protein [candidate division Zixibacteria bacterium]
MKNKIKNSKSKMQNCNSKFKIDIKKRTFTYALEIIKFIDQLNKNDLSAQVIARQLLRSGTSIGANVIEAQASSSKKEFTNFLNYSLKSANESKFWLALLRDSGKTKRESANSLLSEAKQLANILASSILTLKGKRKT